MQKRTRFTDDSSIDNMIKLLASQSVPTREIARQLNRPHQWTLERAHFLHALQRRGWSPREHAQLLDEVELGLSFANIAQLHHRSENAIRLRVRRIGALDDGDLLSSMDVARIFGVKQETVICWAKRGWLSHRIYTMRKYSFTEMDVFGFIDKICYWPSWTLAKVAPGRYQEYAQSIRTEPLLKTADIASKLGYSRVETWRILFRGHACRFVRHGDDNYVLESWYQEWLSMHPQYKAVA